MTSQLAAESVIETNYAVMLIEVTKSDGNEEGEAMVMNEKVKNREKGEREHKRKSERERRDFLVKS